MEIVVTGVGLALPGADSPYALLSPSPAAAEPFDTGARLGRRGHRYKDRATRLALCAALEGLRDAGLLPAGGTGAAEELTVPAGSVSVVASSNLGNLDTVCLASATVEEESAEALSPMALPNASSNVVASWLAIRFGLRGPNLMLCNGPTSGLDAVHWATTLVAAGRAEHVLVVGVETHNEVVERLLGRPGGELLDGAAALVVEGAAAARARGAAPAAVLGRYERGAGLAGCLGTLLSGSDAPAVWFTPEDYAHGPRENRLPVPDTVPRHDLSAAFGRASGALGVLQCAAAVGWFGSYGSGQALLTNGDDTADAVAGLLLSPAGAAA